MGRGATPASYLRGTVTPISAHRRGPRAAHGDTEPQRTVRFTGRTRGVTLALRYARPRGHTLQPPRSTASTAAEPGRPARRGQPGPGLPGPRPGAPPPSGPSPAHPQLFCALLRRADAVAPAAAAELRAGGAHRPSLGAAEQLQSLAVLRAQRPRLRSRPRSRPRPRAPRGHGRETGRRRALHLPQVPAGRSLRDPARPHGGPAPPPAQLAPLRGAGPAPRTGPRSRSHPLQQSLPPSPHRSEFSCVICAMVLQQT